VPNDFGHVEATEGNVSQAPRIGDRLRSARERRGASIGDVAATLKIRAPILEAFEREDHQLLPPRVYTLGLLRTYASYLGLDPASVVAGWDVGPNPPLGDKEARAGTATTQMARIIAMRPGLIRSTRGLLAVGALGAAVLAISLFMLVQLLRFILPPSIAVTYPGDEISNLPAGTVVVELKGVSDARASIIVQTSAGAQLTTAADESGIWEVSVPLGAGRTEVVATAVNPSTGSELSTPIQRVFVVALPDKVAPEISVLRPDANLVVTDADVPIDLTTTPNTQVTITATDTLGGLVKSTLISDSSGHATGDISLPAGRWTVSFGVAATDGSISEATRSVEVSYTGVTVSVTGGETSTWIRVWVDGVLDPTISASGTIISAGTRRTFTGQRRVEIRSGDPSALQFTLNGRTISGISPGGGIETYAFLSTGKVQKSSRR
jgi:cytoskeletal protein RodZ